MTYRSSLVKTAWLVLCRSYYLKSFVYNRKSFLRSVYMSIRQVWPLLPGGLFKPVREQWVANHDEISVSLKPLKPKIPFWTLFNCNTTHFEQNYHRKCQITHFGKHYEYCIAKSFFSSLTISIRLWFSSVSLSVQILLVEVRLVLSQSSRRGCLLHLSISTHIQSHERSTIIVPEIPWQ